MEKAVTDAGYYKADCKRPKDREDADLCEQIRQAQAAEDAVWWTRFQSYLAVCGFAAVVLSLVFTGWAAVASARAARSASRSVAITASMERPYVYISDIELAGTNGLPDGSESSHVVLVFKNYGRSPAFVRRILWGFKVCHPDQMPEQPTYRTGAEDLTIEMVIQPGKTERFTIEGPLLVITPDVWAPGSSILPHVWGQIRYSDFMGGVGETGFVAFQYPEIRVPGYVLRQAAFRFSGPAAYTYHRYREDGSDPS